MYNKDITYNSDARAALKSGIDQLANAVGVTLGPCGRNVVIEKEDGLPHSTKDGVTVAKSVKLSNPIENIGAQMVREAASQTADSAGDGTTTATILAQAMVTAGMKAITTGANPVAIKRGIDKAVGVVVKELESMSKDITNTDEIRQVARISANNDDEIGTLIATAMEKVGREGVITVEEGKSAETSLDVVEGMQFNRGYLSPYFINNNQLFKVEQEDPYILIYDKRISSAKDIVKILEQVIAKNKPLLIIAEDVDGEALATLVVNKAKGILNVCAVKAPDFGEKRIQVLEDIAVLTNGTLISTDKGFNLQKVTIDMLGSCKRVAVDNKHTTIIDGSGTEEKIIERIEEIKALIDAASSDYEKERLQERLGRISGGVAVISIGAETEIEMKEKKDRVDDSLCATKAATEGGIVIGGGLALRKIAAKFQFDTAFNDIYEGDELIGKQIVFETLKAPFEAIIKNAGLDASEIWADLKDKGINDGYDVRTQTFVDMLKVGIIDPTKVVRIALEKAGSVAGTILTTDCVIANNVEDVDKQNQNQGMMMGGY